MRLVLPNRPGKRAVRAGGFAFTLLELLASIAAFILLVLFIAQLVTNVISATSATKRRLDADDQARLVLDRVGEDLSAMVKRSDVDALFSKNDNGNDRIFFYSETPGYLTGQSSAASSVTLVGYTIDSSASSLTTNMLERCAQTCTWDGSLGAPFLTYAGGSSWAPLAASTLAANSLVTAATPDDNFHVLGEGVFRIEFCFLLKDGTYSINPILTQTPASWSGGTFFNSATQPPTASDGAPTYSVGSRWFDSSAHRCYICLQPTSGAAIWKNLGWQDVAAVIVTIATLDLDNRNLVKSASKNLSDAAALLAKARDDSSAGSSPTTMGNLRSSPAVLPAQNWQKAISAGDLKNVLPARAAAAVRVYQRQFYLDQP